MKVTPVSSPHAIQQTMDTGKAANSTREKAINAYMGNKTDAPQAQEHPVANPNQVSAEELSAIAPSVPEPKLMPDKETSNAETRSEETTTKQDEKPQQNQEFERLARQERALRQKVQQQQKMLEERENALKAKEAEIEAKLQDYRTNYVPKDRIKEDALGTLEEAGLTYDDVTQQAVSRQPTDPRILRTIQSLQEEIKSLKQANQDSQKTYQEQQTQAYQSALRQIETDAKALVRDNPAFEFIDKQNQVKQVVRLIEETYKKDGVVLDVEEAAREIENELTERALNTFKTVSKIQKRLTETAQSPKATPQTQSETKTQPTIKTLTNATASTRKLSAKERAILAFKGELKG